MAITEVVQLIVKINRDAVKGIKDFGHGLSFTTDEMKTNLSITKGQERAGTRLGVAFKKMFTGLKGFRMEMLSVMFFGMGMQRLFTGMLNPALELAGVFDIFKTALAVLFLPAALMVQKWAIWFLKWVMSLSPQTKELIGKIVLFGAALGGLLFIIGSVVLGIGGILTAFGSFIGIMVSMGATIIGVLLSPLGLLVGLIAMAVIQSGIFGIIWDGIKNVFGSIGGFFNDIYASILDKFPKIKEKLEELGISTTSIWDALKDAYNKYIKPHIDSATESLKTKLTAAWEDLKTKAKTKWEEIWGKIKTTFDDVVEKIKTEAPEKFREIVKTIIIELAKIPIKGFQKLGREFAENSAYSARVAEIEKMKLPRTAVGGIITSPQARIVGEAGPEAIIPLDKVGGFGSTVVNIVVNAAINSSVDLNNLARRIGEETASSLERNFRR